MMPASGPWHRRGLQGIIRRATHGDPPIRLLIHFLAVVLLACFATLAGYAGLMSLRKDPIPIAPPHRSPDPPDFPSDPTPLPATRPVRIAAEASSIEPAPTLRPAHRALRITLRGLDAALPDGCGLALRSRATKALFLWHPLTHPLGPIEIPSAPTGALELTLARTAALSLHGWLLRWHVDLEPGDAAEELELAGAVQQVRVELNPARGDIRLQVHREQAQGWDPGSVHALTATGRGTSTLDLGWLGTGTYTVELFGAVPKEPVRFTVPGPELVPVVLLD